MPDQTQPSAPCWDCGGARSVPDDFGLYPDGYGPCPVCVIDAGETFVAWDDAPRWPED